MTAHPLRLLTAAAVLVTAAAAGVLAPVGGVAPASAATSAASAASAASAPAVQAAVTPAAAPKKKKKKAPATPRILFGLGAGADSAMDHPLTTGSRAGTGIRMLSTWYNGPGDLDWMKWWRTGLKPEAYAKGYALHLIVHDNGREQAFPTRYGTACGRPYPVSSAFVSDMQELARNFAGGPNSPALYVTLFTEFQTYPCRDNAYAPDSATTNYYRALKDSYRAAFAAIHRVAPNAEISLGWGGWQASYDSPTIAGGRSMIAKFADIMKMSDFQSVQAMDSGTNVADIAAMVQRLGAYGPVMVAHFKPDNGSQATFDADVRRVLTAGYLRDMVSKGLFAFSFMDGANLGPGATRNFVAGAINSFGTTSRNTPVP